jgi:type IV pilus assembly protein PilV
MFRKQASPVIVETPVYSTGLSLIEGLVAGVVLATGVMGVLGLQATALKASQKNDHLLQAQFLASDIVERLTANARAITGGGYSLDGKPPKPGKDCNTAPCSFLETACFDLYEWYEAVEQSLPSGAAGIEHVKLEQSDLYTVLIRWKPAVRNSSGIPYEKAHCGSGDISCYRVTIEL